MDNTEKLQQTMVRGVIAAVIVVITAVTLNHMNEDRQITNCIEITNDPIECSMAIDSYSRDKILLNAIKEIKAERE